MSSVQDDVKQQNDDEKQSSTPITQAPVSTTCVCCTNDYSKTVRKIVTCQYCKASACLQCQKQYLLASVHNAHCMFCKIIWNDAFLSNTFSVSWLSSEYATVEKQRLWELEKSLLPETLIALQKQNVVDTIKQSSVKRNFIFDDLHHQINNCSNGFFSNRTMHYDRFQDKLEDLNALYSSCMRFVKVFKSTLFEANHLYDMNIERMEQYLANINNGDVVADDAKQQVDNDPIVQVVKRQKVVRFHKACPSNHCRGFLSTQWVCGLCHTKVCPDCFAIISKNTVETQNQGNTSIENDTKLEEKTSTIEDEKQKQKVSKPKHVCNPDDLATAQIIKKDSKNCPKCAALIFKTSGCNQMFCTSCFTAFDWNTLTIKNKGIHNPHYFEWLNRTRSNNHPIEDEKMPDANQIDNICREAEHQDIAHFNDYALTRLAAKRNMNSVFRSFISNFTQSVRHVIDYNRVNRDHRNRNRNQQNQDTNDVSANEDLRFRYLKNDINENEFKSLAYKRVKASKFSQELQGVNDMLNTTATITLQNLHTSISQQPFCDLQNIQKTFFNSVVEIIDYYNNALLKVLNSFKSTRTLSFLTIKCNFRASAKEAASMKVYHDSINRVTVQQQDIGNTVKFRSTSSDTWKLIQGTIDDLINQ